ncbi:hypothetical protein QR680_004808 [Steinernema hermaphroditum]|uniref:tRNA (guanine(37)-N1)-methyltransferase n=1 Tax=Steinernema hermaphroditum TaxID=289476 RepID=A0AA39HRB3_9BILA|nr:hypothetical protein QR680_004808 [Steinernema hermaphroditum]
MLSRIFRSFHGSSQILLLNRSVMTEVAAKDWLQPPERVRGITTLDKELFRDKISVPCLPIPSRVVGRVHGLKCIKDFGVPRMNRVKSIVEGSSKEERMILFNPNLLSNSIKEQIIEDISNVTNVDKSTLVFGTKEIELNYEDWDIKRCFKAVLPDGLEFSGFSQIGHIAHCNLREELLPYKHVIASILLDKTAWCKTVVNKVDEINTKFRFFEMELLGGEQNYIAEVKEGKVRYRLDFSKLFWNSRLGTEHARLFKKFNSRSLVYDACAGVGPFAIPAALNGVRRVLANDLNPESVKYLKENVELNKAPAISVFNKDAMDFIREEVAEDLTKEFALPFEERASEAHVLMNLPALAVTFLPAFKNFLKVKPEFPVIVHCHLFAKAHEDVPDEFYPEEAKRMVLESMGVEEGRVKILEVHNVRKVAGRKEMFCVSFELPEDYVVAVESEEPEAKRAKLANC